MLKLLFFYEIVKFGEHCEICSNCDFFFNIVKFLEICKKIKYVKFVKRRGQRLQISQMVQNWEICSKLWIYFKIVGFLIMKFVQHCETCLKLFNLVGIVKFDDLVWFGLVSRALNSTPPVRLQGRYRAAKGRPPVPNRLFFFIVQGGGSSQVPLPSCELGNLTSQTHIQKFMLQILYNSG